MVDIYSRFTSDELRILKKLNIYIKKEKYSSRDYGYLCMDIAQYYNEFEKMKLLNVSLTEYNTVLEKIYNFEELFKFSNPKKSINLYKELNDREKHILKCLFIPIDNRTLSSFEIHQIISYIYNQKKKISNAPISQNDFISAYLDYIKEQHRFFVDENSITNAMCYNKWPKNTYNIYQSLTRKSIDTINKLGIKISNENISAKDYSKISQKLTNNMLHIFGTDITEEECDKLIFKISNYLL